MNKRQKIIAIISAIGAIIIIAFTIWLVHDIIETRRLDETSVVLNDDLTAEFGTSLKASDFIWHLDGSLANNTVVNTSALGETEVEFQYYNLKNRKRTKKFTVNVVDTTAPVIYGQNLYVVNTGYDGDLTELMLSGDDADDHPRREISGTYDLGRPGDYALNYIVTDASGNTVRQPFTLRVVTPSSTSAPTVSDDDEVVDTSIPIANIISEYKNGNTEIGIDVSSWQGEINWEKVKKSGVEFAMIRVGYQAEYGGEYTLDKTFRDNIAGALAVGLPVGVYYYSCANGLDEARRQAEWVLAQVADYPLELGIAFDWEEWNDFNRAGVSFYTLESIADTFLDTVEASGYNGLLYGSKNYLDRFWSRNSHAVWLAQYYDRPTYGRPFALWQLTSSGKVPGISGPVDVDVRYR